MKRYLVIIIALFAIISSNVQAEDVVWEKKLGTTHAIFSPDGTKIFASTGKNTLLIETESGEILDTLAHFGKILGFSDNGKFFYTSKGQKVDAESYEVLAWITKDTLANHINKEPVDFINELSPDGRFLYFTADYIVDGFGGPPTCQAFVFKVDTKNMQIIKYMNYLRAGIKKSRTKIQSMCVSSDNKIIAFITYLNLDHTGGKLEYAGEDLIVIDTETLEKTMEMEDFGYRDKVKYLKVSQDSQVLACIVESYEAKDKIIAYDMNTMKKMEEREYCFKRKISKQLAFSPDSKYVVSSKSGKLVIVRQKPCKTIYEYNIDMDVRDISEDFKYILGSISRVEDNRRNYYLVLLKANWEGNDIIEENNIINLYPNPTNGNTILEYHQIHSGYTQIKITDINGNIIQNITDSYFEKGQQRVDINTSKLPSGNYFITIQNAEQKFTEKLIIKK